MLLLSSAAKFLRRSPDDVWAELPVRGLTVPAEIVTSENAANFYYPDSAY